jgi:hypothetical protein
LEVAVPDHIHTAEIVHLKPTSPRALTPEEADLEERAIETFLALADLNDAEAMRFCLKRALVLFEDCFDRGLTYAYGPDEPIPAA